jgi:hypothetical protein
MPIYDEDDRDEDRGRRRYSDDRGDYDFRRDLPHSGVGLASCVVAVLAFLVAGFGLILTATVGLAELEAAFEAEEPAAMLAFLLCTGAGMLSLVGGVLAVIGLAQSDRKKFFGVLGLCLNILLFLGGCGLMMLLIIAGSLLD